jgi:hypothetical protein
MAGRIEIGHSEKAARGVVAEDSGHRIRHDGTGCLEPGDLIEIALHRGAPIGGNLQLWERPLHREGSALRLYLEDVRRHAAGERFEAHLARPGEPKPPEDADEIRRLSGARVQARLPSPQTLLWSAVLHKRWARAGTGFG